MMSSTTTTTNYHADSCFVLRVRQICRSSGSFAMILHFVIPRLAKRRWLARLLACARLKARRDASVDAFASFLSFSLSLPLFLFRCSSRRVRVRCHVGDVCVCPPNSAAILPGMIRVVFPMIRPAGSSVCCTCSSVLRTSDSNR